jgi:hypothetical protein
VELVEMLKAQGVKFAAPELAPSQIAASILAAWMLAAAGPRSEAVDSEGRDRRGAWPGCLVRATVGLRGRPRGYRSRWRTVDGRH